MADPEFFMLKYPAWMDTARYEKIMLGAFVKDYADPIDVYHPLTAKKSHLRYSATKPVSATFSDFVVNAVSARKRETNVILSSLAGISFTGETKEAIKLEGKLLRLERLEQTEDFFAKVRADKSVKDRVPAWITPWNRGEVCLIVGLMIMEDVEIDWTGTERKDASGNVEVPIDKIVLAATATPSPLGEAGNPQVNVSTNLEEGRVFKAKSGKSQIFAIQLRTVTRGYILNRDRLEMEKRGPAIRSGRKLDSEADEDEDALSDDELFLQGT